MSDQPVASKQSNVASAASNAAGSATGTTGTVTRSNGAHTTEQDHQIMTILANVSIRAVHCLLECQRSPLPSPVTST